MTHISPQDLQQPQILCGIQKTTWAEAQVWPTATAKRVCYNPKYIRIAGRFGVAAHRVACMSVLQAGLGLPSAGVQRIGQLARLLSEQPRLHIGDFTASARGLSQP